MRLVFTNVTLLVGCLLLALVGSVRRLAVDRLDVCAQHVNENAVESFKTEDNSDLFTELQKVFLPCFYGLVCSTAVKDRDAVDQVRGCWCEVLSIDLPG